MKLSFRQLQIVHTVLEMGSVTEAAEALGISRPAVSMMLAECTNIIGFPLFVRTRGAMVPTDEALALRPEIQKMMTAQKDIDTLLAQLSSVEVGRLVIAAVPTLTDHVIPLALAQLSEHHPNILTTVRTFKATEVAEEVLKKRANLGLSIGTEATGGIDIQDLCSGAAICVLRKDHLLASCNTINIRQLLTFPQISVPIHSTVGKLISTVFETAGIPWRPQFEVTHASAACAFARAGLGVAIVDPFSAPSVGDPDLTARVLAPEVRMKVQLLLPSSTRPSRSTRLLTGAVTRTISQLSTQNQSSVMPIL